ncbi:MAG: DUF4215 domain-containing protein [Deltaproteobacteria bacterium]|nr:DUF4215 domain-containing protein [Deltaproteobacteria bacterium]
MSALGLLAAFLSACLFDAGVDSGAQIVCLRAEDCPAPTTCVIALGRCLAPDAIAGEVCGDGILAGSGSEECDDGDANSDETANACRRDCRRARCGDDVVDLGEACDGAAGCRADCAFARCGDGELDVDEECDDGNEEFNDGCLPSSCERNVCGDGFVDFEVEDCDDGNVDDDDGCLSSCLVNACGDGILNPLAEACDDGNQIDEDDCTRLCARNVCGDGIVRAASSIAVEECDDGDGDFDDACLPNCRAARCGDGFLLAGVEDCDDGNDDDDDACRTDPAGGALCIANVCGDGLLDRTQEACDDGNFDDDDACRSSSSTAGIDDCRLARCGDGAVNSELDVDGLPAEECDDGNTISTDDCRIDCKRNVCGDGFVNATVDVDGAATETCDDSNLEVLDGCSDRCSVIIREVNIDGEVQAPITFLPSLGDDVFRVVVPSTDGRLHVVDLINERSAAVPLPGPTHAPLSSLGEAGIVPLDDGSAVSVRFTAAEGVDPPDGGDGTVTVRLSGVDVVVGPALPALGASGAGVAWSSWFDGSVTGLVAVGMDDDGQTVLHRTAPDAGPAEIIAPAVAGNGCTRCGPTGVVDENSVVVGAFAPAGGRMRFVSLAEQFGDAGVADGGGEDAGEPVPDAGVPLVRCASPPDLAINGDVVGQVAITDRGQAWAATTAGELRLFDLDVDVCPPTLIARDVVGLGGTPAGPPAITVDPVFNTAVVVVALTSGALARVVFPEAGPLVTQFPISNEPLVGGVLLNASREVFVGDAAGVLRGVRLVEGISIVFLEVDLGAPLAGPPRQFDTLLVATTTAGRVVALERGGAQASVESWSTAFADFGNTSTGRAEPQTFNGPGLGSLSCAAANLGTPVVVVGLLLLRRRRAHLQR